MNNVALLFILNMRLLFFTYYSSCTSSFCTSSCCTFSLFLPLDSLHCCSKCLCFLTTSNSLSRFLSVSRSILESGPCWLTVQPSLYSVVQLICCAVFCLSYLIILFTHSAFIFLLNTQNRIYFSYVFLQWTRIWWLFSFQSEAFSKPKTCQKNHDNNITMCDIIAEIVLLLLLVL